MGDITGKRFVEGLYVSKRNVLDEDVPQNVRGVQYPSLNDLRSNEDKLRNYSEHFIISSGELFTQVRDTFGLDATVGFVAGQDNNHYFPSIERVQRSGSLRDFFFGQLRSRPITFGQEVLVNRYRGHDNEVLREFFTVKPKFKQSQLDGYLVSFQDETIAGEDNRESILAGAFAYACAKITCQNELDSVNFDEHSNILGQRIFEVKLDNAFSSFLDYLNKIHPQFYVTTGNFMHKVDQTR